MQAQERRDDYESFLAAKRELEEAREEFFKAREALRAVQEASEDSSTMALKEAYSITKAVWERYEKAVLAFGRYRGREDQQ